MNFSARACAVALGAERRVEFNLSADYTNDQPQPDWRGAGGYRDVCSAAARARHPADLRHQPCQQRTGSAFVPPRGSYYNYASYYSPRTAGGGTATGGATPTAVARVRPTVGQFFEGWGTRAEARLSICPIAAAQVDQRLSRLSERLLQRQRPLAAGEFDRRGHAAVPCLHPGNAPEWRQRSASTRRSAAYYLDQQSRYQSWQDLRYSSPLQFQQNDVVNVDTKAVFGHVVYKVTEQLG